MKKLKLYNVKKSLKKDVMEKHQSASHNLWDELEVHINNFEQKSLKDLSNNIKENRI